MDSPKFSAVNVCGWVRCAENQEQLCFNYSLFFPFLWTILCIIVCVHTQRVIHLDVSFYKHAHKHARAREIKIKKDMRDKDKERVETRVEEV